MEFGLWTQMAYVPFAGVLAYQPGDNYVWDQTGSTEILQMHVPHVGVRKIALSHFPVAYNGIPLPLYWSTKRSRDGAMKACYLQFSNPGGGTVEG